MKGVQKSCRACGERFQPDPRAAKVQRYCSKEACQKARQKRKYRRWIRQGAHAAAHQDKLRVWAKDYPDYWQHYRAAHPEYVRRDNDRRALSLQRTRMFRKATDWRQIAVEKLDAIGAEGTLECSAKQTDLVRRVEAILRLLRWAVESPRSAKQTGMAWVGGSEG